MTLPLRRAHRTIWLLLTVSLPVGFLAALEAVKLPSIQTPISQVLPAQLPVLLRSVATDSLVVNLRQAAQGSGQQIEIIVNEPVETSTTVEVQQQSDWQALGLLNAPGVYRFAVPIPDRHPKIRLMDALHQTTLQTIQF